MKTKRILFVTDFYNPFNGMGKFIIDISKIFKKNNYRVIILTVQTENNLNKIERDNGIIIFRSPVSFKFSRGHFSFSLIKDFTSSSETLPALWEPFIFSIFVPNSRANFLTFGLALIIKGFFSDMFTIPLV